MHSFRFIFVSLTCVAAFASASSVTDAAHGNLTAIDVTSGAQKWTFMSEESICSSPAISTDELTVFFGGDKGSLYAVHV